MKRNALISLLALFALASLSWAWWEHLQRRKLESVLEFDRRRSALTESENQRLREQVTQQEDNAFQSRQAEARSEIEKTTSQLRGLPFKKEVQYASLKRKDVKEVLLQKIAEQYSDEDFEHLRLGYVAMGLVPDGFDLKQAYVDLLGEQVAAFYDQHTHKLYMFDDVALDNAQNRVILSHELVHALQDQHFTLKNLPLELKTNDDRVIATASLVEGDATLTMNQFMLGEASFKTLTDTVTGMLGQSFEQLAKAPRLLRETLLFPYTEGAKFCMVLEETGGMAAINAAYQRLPSSSAQILDPAKYLAGEEPIAVEWPETTWEGQAPISDNVLGELGTRILLSDWTDAENTKAAKGWRGDRYLVFRPGGKEATKPEAAGLASVWRTVWRGDEESSRFLKAAQAMWARRYEAKVKAPEGDLPTHRIDFETTGRTLQMFVLPHHEMVLVDAPDPATAEALAKAFARPARPALSPAREAASQEEPVKEEEAALALP